MLWTAKIYIFTQMFRNCIEHVAIGPHWTFFGLNTHLILSSLCVWQYVISSKWYFVSPAMGDTQKLTVHSVRGLDVSHFINSHEISWVQHIKGWVEGEMQECKSKGTKGEETVLVLLHCIQATCELRLAVERPRWKCCISTMASVWLCIISYFCLLCFVCNIILSLLIIVTACHVAYSLSMACHSTQPVYSLSCYLACL